MTAFRVAFILIIGTLCLLSEKIFAESDLRSALEAIDRRQRELAEYEEQKQQQNGFNPYEQLDELAFLNSGGGLHGYEKDYLDDDNYDSYNKRLTSSFRERLEENREKQLQELARNIYQNFDVTPSYDKNELREIWERYNNNNYLNTPSSSSSANKKYYANNIYGVKNTGIRKRTRYVEPDEETGFVIHHHVPRNEDADYQLLKNRYLRGPSARNSYNNNYKGNNKYLISKRSSPFYDNNNNKNEINKRSSILPKQTDPKVAKDLNNIFGNNNNNNATNINKVPTSSIKPEKNSKIDDDDDDTTSSLNNNNTPQTIRKIEKKDKPKMDNNNNNNNNDNNMMMMELNKEVFAPVAPQKKKPLQLTKKSIDWSDYFGLDRRKKSSLDSDNNNLDKEWLMERYHKAIAITAKKRNAELPSSLNKAFRNHGLALSLKDDEEAAEEEQKIKEIDRKLEKIEDEIVEDTIKYTGAHQDVADSKQIQKIKDNIISRLAQAFNIEKMRTALEEYKIEIYKARKDADNNNDGDDGDVNNNKNNDGKIMHDYISEEKRVSVPRKEAIDNSRSDIINNNGETVIDNNNNNNNNIKCTNINNANCHDGNNYKIPADILDTHFGNFECPIINKACNEVSSIVGYYGHVFEEACHIHQMCLLCSNNSWFSPTRQCNSLFLAKAADLCVGKEECKKEARRSIKFLLEINKTFQSQPALTDQCEIQCPDTD